MIERPRIAQHPFGFLPAVTLKLLHRLVELRLRLIASVEMTRGIEPPQRLFDLLHRLLGLHRLITKPLGLSPGAPRMACHPAGISLCLVACSSFPSALPPPRSDARRGSITAVKPARPHAECESIETHGDRGKWLCLGRLRLTACFIGQFHASLKPRPPSAMTCSRSRHASMT